MFHSYPDGSTASPLIAPLYGVLSHCLIRTLSSDLAPWEAAAEMGQLSGKRSRSICTSSVPAPGCRCGIDVRTSMYLSMTIKYRDGWRRPQSTTSSPLHLTATLLNGSIRVCTYMGRLTGVISICTILYLCTPYGVLCTYLGKYKSLSAPSSTHQPPQAFRWHSNRYSCHVSMALMAMACGAGPFRLPRDMTPLTPNSTTGMVSSSV